MAEQAQPGDFSDTAKPGTTGAEAGELPDTAEPGGEA